MSNLTSSAPGAISAFHALCLTAGQAMDPPVEVFDTALGMEEPARYVIIGGPVDHEYEPAALGSYAQYERYRITGTVTAFQGNVDPGDVRAATFELYDQIVMKTLVTNRGAAGTMVLGPDAPADLTFVLPTDGQYRPEPGSMGGMAGFLGVIEFSIQVQARITVP